MAWVAIIGEVNSLTEQTDCFVKVCTISELLEPS